MLEGGIIAKLLDEKWTTYAKVSEKLHVVRNHELSSQTFEVRFCLFTGVLHEASVHLAVASAYDVNGCLSTTRY